MGSTLELLYEYVQDFKNLIKLADEFAKKSLFKDELTKSNTITGYSSFSISEAEQLTSLSRVLSNYGFSQSYESYESACRLLLADYDYTQKAVNTAMEGLKKTASQLYAGRTEESFLWTDKNTSNPWLQLVEMLTENSDESTARRNFYLKRINELTSLGTLANSQLSEYEEIISRLSPLQLEMSFITNDGILLQILYFHNKTGS